MAASDYREPNAANWVGVRPAHFGSQQRASDAVSDGTAILYTVPAGKTFYLFDWSFEANASAAGVWGALRVRNDVDARQFDIQIALFDAAGTVVSSNAYFVPLEIPTGWDIYIQSSGATCDVRGFVHGIRDDG